MSTLGRGCCLGVLAVVLNLAVEGLFDVNLLKSTGRKFTYLQIVHGVPGKHESVPFGVEGILPL